MKMKQEIAGYKEINTPEVLDRSYGKSGHWENLEQQDTSTTPDEKYLLLNL